ncbi:hypothetical protein B0H13DRAFT_1850183 [Mycena leptocephala]|nr:hypothetical protein B0H13DRAFT_1850183 [Mycena leptocephala]
MAPTETGSPSGFPALFAQYLGEGVSGIVWRSLAGSYGFRQSRANAREFPVLALQGMRETGLAMSYKGTPIGDLDRATPEQKWVKGRWNWPWRSPSRWGHLWELLGLVPQEEEDRRGSRGRRDERREYSRKGRKGKASRKMPIGEEEKDDKTSKVQEEMEGYEDGREGPGLGEDDWTKARPTPSKCTTKAREGASGKGGGKDAGREAGTRRRRRRREEEKGDVRVRGGGGGQHRGRGMAIGDEREGRRDAQCSTGAGRGHNEDEVVGSERKGWAAKRQAERMGRERRTKARNGKKKDPGVEDKQSLTPTPLVFGYRGGMGHS